MSGKSFKKILGKTLIFFVLFFFVAGAAFGPIGIDGSVNIAEAQEEQRAPEGLDCFDGFDIQIDHCAALVGFYVFFVPSTWLLYTAGTIFDTMLIFSLSNKMINQPFVTEAWEAVRDVANMAFIFVLLYIAIATILNLGDYKKLLVNLVIVALVINFSAFFTKIIIDASNIVALGFYNAISAPPIENVCMYDKSPSSNTEIETFSAPMSTKAPPTIFCFSDNAMGMVIFIRDDSCIWEDDLNKIPCRIILIEDSSSVFGINF